MNTQVLWILITIAIIAGVAAGLYFWGKRLQKKYDEQQEAINQTKQAVTLFVIDKKKDKPDNLKLPKQVKQQLPKLYRRRKMPVIIAKIGPQIQTLLCDEAVYQAIPVKKQVKVELAGILVVKVLSGRIQAPKKQSLLEKAKAKLRK